MKAKPKKVPMKWKPISLSLWRFSGIAFSGGTFEEFERFLKEVFNIELAFPAAPAGCYVFDNVNDIWLIWVKSSTSHGEIAHEASHVAFRVLNRLGLVHTEDSEEAFTYTLTYILDQFYYPKNWKPLSKFDPSFIEF